MYGTNQVKGKRLCLIAGFFLAAGILLLSNFILATPAIAQCGGNKIGCSPFWECNCTATATCYGRLCDSCTGELERPCWYDTNGDGAPDCTEREIDGGCIGGLNSNWSETWCDGDSVTGAVCMINLGVGGSCGDIGPWDCSLSGLCCIDGACGTVEECAGGPPPGTPDFSLQVVQLSRTVNPPPSTTYDVALTSSNSYNGTVNLSRSGCPAPANCTFSAGSVTFTNDNPSPGPGISIVGNTAYVVLTVNNTAGVAPGTYTLTVTGTDTAPDPDLIHSDTTQLIVQTLYIDIGLRLYDGTEVIAIAAEPQGTLTSPLRISKSGIIYGLVLVPISDPNASKIRMQTSSGVKALRKF